MLQHPLGVKSLGIRSHYPQEFGKKIYGAMSALLQQYLLED